MDLLLLLATSYSYSYSTTTADTSGISLISALISLALSVVVLVAEWKIFTKAGEEGWKCLIPIYNVYVLSKIVGISFWYILLCFIPFGALAWIIIPSRQSPPGKTRVPAGSRFSGRRWEAYSKTDSTACSAKSMTKWVTTTKQSNSYVRRFQYRPYRNHARRLEAFQRDHKGHRSGRRRLQRSVLHVPDRY